MTVNLLRMAVGIDSVDHLKKVQLDRLEARRANGERAVLITYTRNIPKRIGELTDGGSIYWVIKRYIRLRQPILGIERATNAEGRPYCAIELSPSYIATEMYRHKAFQGWRYLKSGDAPPDVEIRADEAGDLPADLADELRDLGLL